MAMFESLLKTVNERFGMSNKAESLLSALLALMTDERRGGLAGFLDLFHRVGLGETADSWVLRGANTPLSNQQLEDAFSLDTLSGIASRVDIPTATATSAMAFMIPQVVDNLTPNGVLPDGTDLSTNIGTYLTDSNANIGTGGMPDRVTASVDNTAVRPAAFAAPEAEEDTTLRWILPLVLLAFLVGIGYYTCRPNEAVKVAEPKAANTSSASANVSANSNTGNSAVVVPNNSNTVNANMGGAVISTDNNDAAIREANERAKQALSTLSANGTPQQVVDALNLSIINFAKDSAEIPEDNRNLLRQAAEVLKKAPADTRIEIGGHTDSDGDDAHNQTLSEQRANAVRAELIKNGVNQNTLAAKGYGEMQTKATNDTPEGRFQNRRIEYKISTGGATTKVQ